MLVAFKNDTNPLNFLITRLRQIVLTHTKYFVKTDERKILPSVSETIISACSDIGLTECIFFKKLLIILIEFPEGIHSHISPQS